MANICGAWRPVGTTAWSSAANYTHTFLAGESVTIEFRPIALWNLPPNQTVTLTLGQDTPFTALYTHYEQGRLSRSLELQVSSYRVTHHPAAGSTIPREKALIACRTDPCKDQDGVDAWSSAYTAGNIATGAFIIGAAGIASGAVVWLLAKPSPDGVGPQISLGPGGLQVLGKW